MRFSLATVTGILLAAAPAFVRAQDPSQGQGQGQMVMVGANGELSFTPPSMTAAVGSNITFTFMSKNHSLVQSSFASPCEPLANGFSAQYFPIDPNSNTNTFPTVTIAVTTDAAIWFYCPQTNPANHCKAGMVGAINPPPDKTFEQFQAIAKGEAPPPAANGGGSSVPGSSAPGSTLPGAASPTGAPISGSPSAPGSVPPPATNSPSAVSPVLPNGSGAATSSTGAAPPAGTNAALPQSKGAFTAMVIGVLGVVAALL